jgi:hypothetical protein
VYTLGSGGGVRIGGGVQVQVVFDGPSPPFISQTLRDGTTQVQMNNIKFV